MNSGRPIGFGGRETETAAREWRNPIGRRRSSGLWNPLERRRRSCPEFIDRTQPAPAASRSNTWLPAQRLTVPAAGTNFKSASRLRPVRARSWRKFGSSLAQSIQLDRATGVRATDQQVAGVLFEPRSNPASKKSAALSPAGSLTERRGR